MNPFRPLAPVEPVWPRKPPAERRERRREPGGNPAGKGPAAEEPQPERQSDDVKPPVPGRIVDDYA
ncbi:hypothetical protein [Wenzhouxiangella sp. XN24]|uniref:hypothetical protein n=1 Tax=Wenzhouxiangella sp. XN24 TaxID=2713569 RepID=UPI0013ED5B20|nr:hypothetical protein [Wenzhouxiangella sp. XN24]NGX15307.1 hypothetical protein [Wenzhouxiangella sp. XN24]